jgi:hypothetical protein
MLTIIDFDNDKETNLEFEGKFLASFTNIMMYR